MKKEIKAAIPVTLPVMMGYVSVGTAFGLLFEQTGYNFLWAFLMSSIVYAGAMQFIAIQLFTAGVGFVEMAIVTLFVNLRHMFYGLSFIKFFNGMGRRKTYMIFSLTDETYSLLGNVKIPEGLDKRKFFFTIAIMNQLYWITGTMIGSLAGTMINFNTEGLDFAMTALFVVIFIDQWRSYKTHLPAIIGTICTGLALWVFGPEQIILPAMASITLALVMFRKQIEGSQKEEEKDA
ncbi:AzlC family ABC transporter permease [Alkalicella caledoniensis]|uniref:AzlC family ABC transporter permease n=1 Tax=Alkalicella caledoniensis TaxID=2731377 RepID=A0A7G9W7M5_ALKCA|nr:AzlC family ABC transporter permease [Alkalicella caledoniensis]QNO14687.1 AzlC family ABC transporter permease [Alkalicella caledoniensis]